MTKDTGTVCQQAVILVGGRGSRLGGLTDNCPKPLMLISENVTFLDLLIDEVLRQGFKDILLLAGYLADQMIERYSEHREKDCIRVIVEKKPMGTGGALANCLPFLEEQFLLLNGDTWFDFNWRALEKELHQNHDAQAVIALLPDQKESRYGNVLIKNNCILSFAEKEETQLTGIGDEYERAINGGAYYCRRSMLDEVDDTAFSLEEVLLPKLAQTGQLLGIIGTGYFIDIGLPETLEYCRSHYPDFLKRPALFLDRDGTLNHDAGYTHKREDCQLIKGAAELVRHYCDRGWHVFVVTNQAGIGKGLYDESAMIAFHAELNHNLILHGGGIVHDFNYCPYTGDANNEIYKIENHPDRKPNPGMILSLSKQWPINMESSLLIGDREKDVEAARRANIEGFLFTGDDLWEFACKVGLIKGDR